jgi:hypothetical protein
VKCSYEVKAQMGMNQIQYESLSFNDIIFTFVRVVSNQACVLIKLVKRVPLSLSQQSKAEQIHVIEKDCNVRYE